MTAVNFNPASDGLSLPIANLINSHLRNPFYYAQWVDESPTRTKLESLTCFQTHPHPNIWTEPLSFSLGVATAIDPKFTLSSSKTPVLENKPSTAYLIILLCGSKSIYTITLENTPSGKTVLYYRTEQVMAIREVAFEIFKRDLAEICKTEQSLRMGSDLALKKYFGSTPSFLKLTSCYVPLSYPDLSALPRWQPFNFKRECLLWLKIALIINMVVVFLFLNKCSFKFPVKHTKSLETKIIDVTIYVQACATVAIIFVISATVFSLYKRPYRGPYFQLK